MEKMWFYHRHLSNIDRLMSHTTCLVCFISTFNGRSKKKEKKENALDDVALVAGTQQNLSNLYSLDIYGFYSNSQHFFLLITYESAQ
jgi:hypothetical protein